MVSRWTVKFKRSAAKQFKILPEEIKEVVTKAVDSIRDEGPTPGLWDVKKTANFEYRMRLNYRYRMRYSINKTEVLVEIFYVGHRKDAYH